MRSKIALIAALSGLMLSSCVDLDQLPESFLTPDNIILDEANVTSLASGLYKDLWSWNYGYNCRSQILGIGADDIHTGSLSKRYAFGDELNFSESQFDADVADMWQNMFNLIRSANTMIESVPNSDELSDELKKAFLGEAYFLRGFAYFNLVRYFGQVPLFEDPTCSFDIYGNSKTDIPRADIADVYDRMIIPSMQTAIDFLPDRGRTGDNSTVSKWAAKTCMADIYLTVAGWPLKRSDYYQKAKDITADIIKNSKHKLVDNYADLWKESTKSDNTEHIFALNHSAITMASNYGKSYFVEEESTAAWSDYVADSCFYTRYPDDARREFNFVTSVGSGFKKLVWTKWNIKCPAIAKYRDYGDVTSAQTDGITPIYRYAEVLLMYAEAQNMADGSPNADAYKAINDVRTRANSGIANDLSGLSHDEFAKAVSDERGWEFFAEFRRWFELTRTENVWEANQYNPRVKADLDKRGVTKDNRNIYLMPIPTSEIRLTNWTQNPR